MAEEGVKISELTDLPQPTGEEYIPVEVGGQNKKVKLGNIKPDALVKTEQTLTEEEQKQVQTNIGVKNTVDLVGAGTPVKVTEVWTKDKYRTSTNYGQAGILADGPGINIYKAIKVNAGDIIVGQISGTANVSEISKVGVDNTFIGTIFVGTGKTDKINLPINFNGYIEFCGRAYDFNITIIPCKLASALTPLGGPNRKLYEAAGAKFNEETGFYELNGLTDITEEEMADIYQYSTNYIGFGAFDGCKARTLKIFPTALICDSGPSLHTTFRGCTLLEVLVFHKTYDIVPSNLSSTFKWCAKLNSIIGVINLTNINKYSLLYESFVGCQKLVNIKIKLLKANIGFKDSPLLSKESLQYMVENSAATSPITITLHADVYAKVASAEAEWGDIFTLSQSKNISFVQA